MKIGNFDLDKDILIVAEIGNNHEGSYSLAEEMIGLAAEAGAGAVKFQTIVPDRLVSCTQKDRIEQLEKFRLSYDEFEKLSKVAQEENVLFLSTPFDIESVRFLNRIVPAFKIASGDNNFYPMIEVIAETGKPIILSAGLADLNQIRFTKSFTEKIWNENGIHQEMSILHCVVSYPAPHNDVNLLAINELKKLDVTVGYSDHTLGIEAAVLSASLGARIIEKHFTSDKNFSDFHDHKLSADPGELRLLVQRIREAVDMLGDGEKQIQDSEKGNVDKVRRSIVAACDLAKDTALTSDMLIWVRPGRGIPPGDEYMVLGKTLLREIREGEMVLRGDVR